MMNYISSSKAGKVSLEQLQKCLARIKRLGLGLTEAELIQLANHLPETEVELYLVRTLDQSVLFALASSCCL